METIQDSEGRIMLHCRKKGCIYHGDGQIIVPGRTLEEALERLKPGERYVGGVAPCAEGEHEWELITPDPD